MCGPDTIAGMMRIRAARRAELPEVYRLLRLAFPHQPRALFVRQTERDSTFRLRHLRVAEIDGQISAVVRIFARTMLLRGAPVRAGGVGSVAAHPDARGLGLPTALLQDAIELMEREAMALSFLFTGIPAFYERLGYSIVPQTSYDADAREAAALPRHRSYRMRPMRDGDIGLLLRIYASATAGSTGAIVRTSKTWRDATSWLQDRCTVAEREGVPVAYLRGRARPYGYQLLEAEHAAGHEAAMASLLADAGVRASRAGLSLTMVAPPSHAIASALSALPSTREQHGVEFPMMVRAISHEGPPQLPGRALAEHFRQEVHFWNSDRI